MTSKYRLLLILRWRINDVSCCLVSLLTLPMGAFASITWWTAWAWLTISIVGRADDGEVELVGSNFANARDPLPAASRGHCGNGPTQRSACIAGSTAPGTQRRAIVQRPPQHISAINPPLNKWLAPAVPDRRNVAARESPPRADDRHSNRLAAAERATGGGDWVVGWMIVTQLRTAAKVWC